MNGIRGRKEMEKSTGYFLTEVSHFFKEKSAKIASAKIKKMLNFQHVTVFACFLGSHIDPRNRVSKTTIIFLHRNIMQLQI